MAKLHKRTHADGSTTWHCIADAGMDPATGKRRQRRLTAPTRAALEEKLTTLKASALTGAYIDPSKTTVREYLDQWLEATAADVRPNSARAYAHAITHHLTPHLGGHRLNRLQPLHIQRWLADEQAAGAAPASLGLYLMIARKALGHAVAWRLLTFNPAAGVRAPRIPQREPATWTAEQAKAFLTATADDDMGAAYRLGLTLGCRIGELLALTWADVNLTRGTLTIQRTVTGDRDGRQTIGETKTASSRRRLALPAACVAALKAHKARQAAARLAAGPLWQDTGLVFPDPIGRPWNANTARTRFADAVTAAGLPRLTPHGMRHTAATLALEAGEAPKVVQQRLGHSSVAMTLAKYGHVTAAMEAAATERLDRLFG